MDAIIEALSTTLAEHGLPGLVAALCLMALVLVTRAFNQSQLRYIHHLEKAEVLQREDAEFNREAMQAIVSSLRELDGEYRVTAMEHTGRFRGLEREIQALAVVTRDSAQASASAAACAKDAAESSAEALRIGQAISERLVSLERRMTA